MFGFSSVGSILEGLKRGEMVIVVDDPGRENEGDLVMLAEHATPEAVNFMARYGRGLICMPMATAFIERLNLQPMVTHNTDNHQTAFTVSIDIDNGGTGISASDRSETILRAIHPEARPEEFRRPGHVFPLAAKAGGVRVRRGHTEASVDLAALCGSAPAAVICEILNEDGSMARVPELIQFAKTHGLKMMTIEDLSAYLENTETLITGTQEAVLEYPQIVKAASADMPTRAGRFTIHGFVDAATGAHHVALALGLPGNASSATDETTSSAKPLVRIHSECLTGDVFGSKRCDCGEQLQKSMAAIEAAGCGVLIYLRQEGRGIGLINKLKAYALQEQGHDTISANHALGFETDLRNYDAAAAILKGLGISQVRLITNNAEKMLGLEAGGIQVLERVSLASTLLPENESYLKTKIAQLQHDIQLM